MLNHWEESSTMANTSLSTPLPVHYLPGQNRFKPITSGNTIFNSDPLTHPNASKKENQTAASRQDVSQNERATSPATQRFNPHTTTGLNPRNDPQSWADIRKDTDERANIASNRFNQLSITSKPNH